VTIGGTEIAGILAVPLTRATLTGVEFVGSACHRVAAGLSGVPVAQLVGGMISSVTILQEQLDG
jgi:hypothetical protein